MKRNDFSELEYLKMAERQLKINKKKKLFSKYAKRVKVLRFFLLVLVIAVLFAIGNAFRLRDEYARLYGENQKAQAEVMNLQRSIRQHHNLEEIRQRAIDIGMREVTNEQRRVVQVQNPNQDVSQYRVDASEIGH